MRNGANSPKVQRRSFDRGEISSCDIESHFVYATHESLNKSVMSTVANPFPRLELIKVKEGSFLALCHHIVRTASLCKRSVNSFSCLGGLNRRHHQFATKVRISEYSLQIDPFIAHRVAPQTLPSLRFPTRRSTRQAERSSFASAQPHRPH